MATQAVSETFTAVVHAGHKQHALELPFDPAKRWGSTATALWPGRRGHRVHVHADAADFDSAVVSRSGRHWLLIEDEVREQTGWQRGDSVTVKLTPLPMP